MNQKIQSLKGMQDWLPTNSAVWQTVERHLRAIFSEYNYREIRPNLIEQTRLFNRSLGEVTDIVEKEMYSFIDKDGESITLRPEATAGIVRAGIEHGLFYNQIQKLWHIGPMFRHEKQQLGRYRQFHQADVEVFGVEGPDIDAEILVMTYRLWQRLGVADVVRLELNSMGEIESRKNHRNALISYFEKHRLLLDADSLRRLQTNPLRILDSKNPAMADMLRGAPTLIDYLDDSSRIHLEGVCKRLDYIGIPYVINHRIVRGMDYYTRTVFEWVTDKLGAQGTVCGGGRYDGMVESLGGRKTPAIGFGLGIERLILLCQACNIKVDKIDPIIYMITLGEAAEIEGLKIAELLRQNIPNLHLMMNIGGGKMKSQMKRADDSGARFAIIIGENELLNKQIILKDLREDGSQCSILMSEIADEVKKRLV